MIVVDAIINKLPTYNTLSTIVVLASLPLLLFSFLQSFVNLMAGYPQVFELVDSLEVKEVFVRKSFRRGRTKKFVFMPQSSFVGCVFLYDGRTSGFYFKHNVGAESFERMVGV